MKHLSILIIALVVGLSGCTAQVLPDVLTPADEEIGISSSSYKIVDTGVEVFFTNNSKVGSIMETEAFYGQDAHYDGYQPSYEDHDDGTVSDLVTGLMWQQTMDEKMTFDDAVIYANESDLGGYSDWRIPTIKELFSLILYTGESGGETAKVLFIDTEYFDQPIGDTSIGEREIDAQVWSSTKYVGKTMNGADTIFGVNFVDGRIKGYGLIKPKTKAANTGYFRLVRGNTDYGENIFVDNGDGTISDLATGLMWQAADDGQSRDWEEALSYSEDSTLAGYTDWRLPNVKELQSIVDYTKSPQTTGTPAIDGLFVLSEISDPSGSPNYGFYWSSTTHQDGRNSAESASYVAFGEAQGEMNGQLMDVHGAGAVRSDPKSGDQSQYPSYFGPQGDVRYVYNYVLAVRNLGDAVVSVPPASDEVIVTEVEDSADSNQYNLFAPLKSNTTYLMDEGKQIVHTWASAYNPGNSVYLSEDGSILRTGALRESDSAKSSLGGSGGIVERIDWNGSITWSYEYATDDVLLHHDIEELPNGNVLMIAWETMTKEEAIESGRNPDLINDEEIWPDHIIEVKPNGVEGGEIVWEWHLKDHLIQDYDQSKLSYGIISDYPELVDLNYIGLKGPLAGGADWTHLNSIDYNATLDQIMVSVHGFSEIWIIDHSTTTVEAASHSGGDQGKGGDLLYRWGNPQAYGIGSEEDRVFYGQHDASWIGSSANQAEILVFNNGVGRDNLGSIYSTVDQITVVMDDAGNYSLNPDGVYLPETLTWSYIADNPTDFYSQNISGAQRLANGNTLICSGSSGEFFEVDTAGNIVWVYKNEFAAGNQVDSPVFRVNRYTIDLNALS